MWGDVERQKARGKGRGCGRETEFEALPVCLQCLALGSQISLKFIFDEAQLLNLLQRGGVGRMTHGVGPSQGSVA